MKMSLHRKKLLNFLQKDTIKVWSSKNAQVQEMLSEQVTKNAKIQRCLDSTHASLKRLSGDFKNLKSKEAWDKVIQKKE